MHDRRALAGAAACAFVAVASCSLGFDREDLTRDRAREAPSSDGATMPSRYAAVVLADDPVGYYPFEEPSGAARDASGRGRECTLSPAVERISTGAVGRGLRFSGVRTFVDCGDAFAFPDQRPFTVELWLAFDPASAFDTIYRRVFSREGTDEDMSGYYLLFHREGRLLVQANRWVESGGKGVYQGNDFDGAGVLGGQRFQHVVVVYDGATLTTWVDGRRAATGGGTGRVRAGGAPFVLGATSYSVPESGAGFVGDLDELAVYDRALSPAQIEAHYRAR